MKRDKRQRLKKNAAQRSLPGLSYHVEIARIILKLATERLPLSVQIKIARLQQHSVKTI